MKYGILKKKLLALHMYKCYQRYVGETERILRARLFDHKGYVNNQVISVTIWDYFNLPGHSLANLKITILEKVKKSYELYRKNPAYRRQSIS